MSEEYIGMEWSQDILERLQMIAYEETVREPFRKYFRTTATFLSALLMGSSDDNFLLPPYRYLDADYLVRELSPYGSSFSVLSMELYRLIPAIHEGRIEHVKATLYTFIELYCMFEEDYLPENKDGVRCLPDPQRVQDVLYAYAYDYWIRFLATKKTCIVFRFCSRLRIPPLIRYSCRKRLLLAINMTSHWFWESVSSPGFWKN